MSKYTCQISETNDRAASTVVIEGALADAVAEFGGLRSGWILDEDGERVVHVRNGNGRTRVTDVHGDERLDLSIEA